MSRDRTQFEARAIMRPVSSTLRGTDRPLCEIYDVALLDLDGVVYIGRDAVPNAPAALASAREHGMHLAFVTNNAARPPVEVAAHLTELGIQAEAEEVITSSQAAARWLSDHLDTGARVLVVGTTGLRVALEERGLTPVDDASSPVDAVVQGYSPTLDWALLAEGAVAINSGAVWVATNVDPTVPSPRGPLPGNGSLVAALKHATGAEPVVTGKPDPTMHRETLIRTGARKPIVVGDRLDTDIEGANAAECPSLLVFSGVTTPAELLVAPPDLRPTYLGADVGALLTAQPEPEPIDVGARCGRWIAVRADEGLELRSASTDGRHDRSTGDGSPAAGDGDALDDDALDALRVLCAVHWANGGATADDEAAATAAVVVHAAAGDDAASGMVKRLGLG
jgi:HAD superfamily hydrolase (TIGR01450 family)